MSMRRGAGGTFEALPNQSNVLDAPPPGTKLEAVNRLIYGFFVACSTKIANHALFSLSLCYIKQEFDMKKKNATVKQFFHYE